MQSNWHVSQDRFKALQAQARATRAELVEVRQKQEAAAVAATVPAATSPPVRFFIAIDEVEAVH